MNNQPEEKNARLLEEMYLDVCLVSKGRRTTYCSLPFQSIHQILHRLKSRKQQQGRQSSGKPKGLSSQMPFLMGAVVFEAARNSGKSDTALSMTPVYVSCLDNFANFHIWASLLPPGRKHIYNSASHVFEWHVIASNCNQSWHLTQEDKSFLLWPFISWKD